MDQHQATSPSTPLREQLRPLFPYLRRYRRGILVGMGLYDTPETFDEDPQLNNYRSTVSSLLGSTYRPQEPRGKGLKLEETWEPPKSDDGEDDDDEDEDDDSEGQNRKVAA
ncbi:MAG: hypothetical protein IH789_09180 [Acidobacteria bacterium]|nr:hypothetical protein [Acidobacteriota bacterium]